jgi:hypothetical protein
VVLRKLKTGEEPVSQWQEGKYVESSKRTNEWREQKLLGDYLFECIEHLENIGMYATVEGEPEALTCMDYILHRAARKKPSKKRVTRKSEDEISASLKSMNIIVHPDSYHGSNMDLYWKLKNSSSHPDGVGFAHPGSEQIAKDRAKYGKKTPSGRDTENLDEFLYRFYGMRYNLLTAIAEFYFKNPNANPELSHCSSIIDDPEYGWINAPVNCLTQFIEADFRATERGNKTSRYAMYIPTDPFIKLINSGARCGVYSHTTYNNVDIYERSSCLDAVLDREVKGFVARGSLPSRFVLNMRNFNMSLDCQSESKDGDRQTIPCMQKMIGTYDTNWNNILKWIRSAGSEWSDPVLDTLAKTYRFKKTDPADVEESTAIDYMLNTGIYIDKVLSYPNAYRILTEDIFCKSPDATEPGRDPNISCLSKLIMNLRNEKYGEFAPGVSIGTIYGNLDDILISGAGWSQLATESCWDGISPVQCVSYLVDIVANTGKMASTFYRILSEYPVSGLTCTSTEHDEPVATNCLDKIIGTSTSPLMTTMKESRTIIDVMDCKDWNGFPMNCLDKLFQRHEMWMYSSERKPELGDIIDEDGDAADVMYTDIAFESATHRLEEDPGFTVVSGEYDLGSVKAHSPSKAFGGFASAIRSQIAEYEKDGMPRGEINYLRELLASVTSDVPSRENFILPRIYKMLDVYDLGISGTKRAGFETLISPDRVVPVSYNMFECKDDKNRTISCMQRHIDETYAYCDGTPSKSECSLATSSVMRMKGIFKDGMCTDHDNGGSKMPCITYALQKLPKKFDDDAYAELISRGDFGKSRDVKVTQPDGTVKTLAEILCSHVSIERISNVMSAAHIFTDDEMNAIQNQHPSHDAEAFKLYANCICTGIKDPMEKRICLDTQCFKEFVRGQYDKKNWAVDFLSMDNTTDAYRRASVIVNRNDPYDDGTKIVRDLTVDNTRDAYYPYVYNESTDYFGLAGVYDLEFNPAKYHITNIERTDASGKVTSVFNLKEALVKLVSAARRTTGMTITMAIPQVDGSGEYILDTKGSVKEFKGQAKIESIELTPPSDSTKEDYNIGVKFSCPDDRFAGGTRKWVKFYPASEAFGNRGIFGRSDLKDVVIRYVRERDLVNQLSTRRKAAEGTTKLKLVVSNRPADYMRASTCQQWRSCLHSDLVDTGFNSNALAIYLGTGGYIAYIANDEFSPTWHARAFMLPLMARKKGDPKREDSRDSDYNNNFRVPKVYGMTSHKDLLHDALTILIRERGGYNKESIHSGDTGWYISDWNVQRLKNAMRYTARQEAYHTCIENHLLPRETVTLPGGQPVAQSVVFPGGQTMSTELDCTDFLTKTSLYNPYSSASTDMLEVARNIGALSNRTNHRVLATQTWKKYNEGYNLISGSISEDAVKSSKKGGTTVLTYLKPLTVPS